MARRGHHHVAAWGLLCLLHLPQLLRRGGQDRGRCAVGARLPVAVRELLLCRSLLRIAARVQLLLLLLLAIILLLRDGGAVKLMLLGRSAALVVGHRARKHARCDAMARLRPLTLLTGSLRSAMEMEMYDGSGRKCLHEQHALDHQR